MSTLNNEKARVNVTTYITWITIVLVILSIGYGYIAWRLIIPAKLTMPWKLYAWIALGVLFLLPLVRHFSYATMRS